MDKARVFLASLAFAAFCALGCASEESSTVCDQAVEKYKECKFQVDGGDNLNCTGEFECAQNCALAATCDEIKLHDENSGYQKCLDGCKGQ